MERRRAKLISNGGSSGQLPLRLRHFPDPESMRPVKDIPGGTGHSENMLGIVLDAGCVRGPWSLPDPCARSYAYEADVGDVAAVGEATTYWDDGRIDMDDPQGELGASGDREWSGTTKYRGEVTGGAIGGGMGGSALAMREGWGLERRANLRECGRPTIRLFVVKVDMRLARRDPEGWPSRRVGSSSRAPNVFAEE